MEYQPLQVQPFDPRNHAAAAAERRNRLMGKAPVGKPRVVAPKPAPRVQYVHSFDEHVICWREHLGRERMTAFQYVSARCRDLGLSIDDLVGPSRCRKHVFPRQMLMWELKRRNPAITLPQLGRIFGNRDHTTILHGIRAHEKRRTAE